MAVMVDRQFVQLVKLRTAAIMEEHRAGPADEGPLPMTPLEWAESYRRIDNRPFSLERFHPLRAIYEDPHPHVVVMKPAQRGVSEWAINYTCFALDRGAEAWQTGKDGLNVGYIFPTQAALSDFSKERFSGVRDESPYLTALFRGEDFDAVSFKKVRQSYLYLRGAWSESHLLSFAADVLVLDEFDRMDASGVALARRRLNASTVRRELDLSTPTMPGTGIHALYLQSDQQVYRQPCPGCGEPITLDFLRDCYADGQPRDDWSLWPRQQLSAATFEIRCPGCRAPWSEADRCAPGFWEAERPENTDLRGYKIPALAFPFVSLRALAQSSVSADPSELTEFYRSDLGEPYVVGGGGKVTEDMLGQLSAALPGGRLPTDVVWRDVTMGVDVGARFHYRVSAIGPDGATYVLALGYVGSWDALDLLLDQHHVRLCIVDALPELHGARAFADRHVGRVAVAFYPSAEALKGELVRVSPSEPIVQINRTMAMDAVYASIVTAAERWPADLARAPETIGHLTAPSRATVVDKRGQERVEWVHTAPDHLFHATVYDQVARRVLEALAVATQQTVAELDLDEHVQIGASF